LQGNKQDCGHQENEGEQDDCPGLRHDLLNHERLAWFEGRSCELHWASRGTNCGY
jgi:hypothetical protein